MGVKLNTASGGSVSIEPTNTASNFTLTVPAQTGTVLTNKTAGTVLQVVNATTNGNTYSFTSGYDNAFGPSASITPSSSSNKILIIASGSIYISASGESHVDIAFNGTRLSNGGSGDGLCVVYNTGAMAVPYTITHLHSPATTSSVTYAVTGHHISGTKTTTNSFRGSDLSQIFLLEIAA